MNTITFDYLDRLDTIPPVKDAVDTLRKKYGYPLKYYHDPTSNTGGRPGVSDAFYAEFTTLSSNIIAYLKKEFPIETADSAVFRDNLQNLVNPFGMVAQTGLDAWIGAETRPEPHGGYPGCQWIYETSPSGRVAKTVPTLVRAYTMCVSAKAARTEKEVRFAESKRIAEEKQKAKDDAAKLAYQRKVSHYTKLLCDSLGIHYFPERIIRGVRRPAEWLPSF